MIAQHSHVESWPDTFEGALLEHLRAIAQHDVDGFAATLSDDAAACTIGPSGGVTYGKPAILAAHAAWFASSDWSFVPTIVWSKCEDSLGCALLDITYTEGHGSAAKRSRFFLTMVFVRESRGWRFFYDQNTPCA